MIKVILGLLFSISAYGSLENAHYYHFSDNKIPEFNCTTIDCYKDFEAATGQSRITESDHRYINDSDAKTPPGTQVVTMGRKARATVIAIHGLYGDSSQFKMEIMKYLYLGFNIILVTLPGHGPDQTHHKELKYTDWIEYVNKAAQLGLKIGDQLILTGQSTGGLLSFWYSIYHPKEVLAQILIEPAFKVQNHLTWSTCYGRKLIDDARSLDFLARIFLGHSVKQMRQAISLNMGCQVHLMSQYVFPNIKRKYKKVDFGDDEQNQFDGYEIPEASLFRKVNVPTYITYTGNDDVVDADLIKEVIKSSPLYTSEDHSYLEKDKQKINHGYYVQRLSYGSMGFGRYKDRVKGDKSFDDRQDLITGFLEQIPGLKSYMEKNYDYNNLTSGYSYIFGKARNLKDGLKVLKKVLDDSNLHTLNDSEHHQLTRLGGLSLSSEQCYFFNPNNQLCELTNQFYEKFDRGLDEFESAISYEYRRALDTFSSQKDEEILRCGTSYCYDNKMQITVAQLKSTYLDNLRKHYSKDVEFRNLLEKIESSPNLLGEDEIPKFLPNEWLDTFTYPEPKK